ncbi:hypothetical protein H8M03_03025 [Sphingomonas sabuli]|uniref:Peptidase S1 domain-containing protein n=1 Tax=Sphingomonas sabuli TaxID=2764186 RepID=A0A7G9L3Y5_9SPHN|nr:S1 family peptidase [Sphingomonas sabuli]QNM83334.1 hypothetical protein H8M03_03025 [Sphingomonas sabuli]
MTLLALAASMAMASSAMAQEPPVPEPPSERVLAGGRNPVVSYLMQAYGLSEAVAEERLAVQSEVMELAQRLERENDPAYADIWIEHEPVYKINIAFLDKNERQAFRESLSPRLRRYVQIVPVNKSRKQKRQDLEELSAALRSANIAFDGWFEEKKQRFDLGVGSASDLARAEPLVPPRLRGTVDLVVRKLPAREAPPTGVVSGDFIAGGHAVWISDNPAHPNPTQCTFGFPVRYGASRLKGVLTAAHCTVPAPQIFAHRFGNPVHFIKFDWARPIIRKLEGPYDYMVLEGSSALGDDGLYDVYFENPNNQVPGVTGNYFDIYAYAAKASMKVGDAVCKSGDTTKLTCGTIKAIDGTAFGYPGFFVVSNTSQPDLTAPGDSGGPWFFNPGTGSKAIAIGMHSGGTEGCVGRDCNAYAMFIELIDDHDATIKLPSTP